MSKAKKVIWIKINDKYSIKVDKYNYILYQTKAIGKDGEEKDVEKPIAYCRTMQLALKAFLEQNIQRTDADNVENWICEINHVIDQAIQDINKIKIVKEISEEVEEKFEDEVEDEEDD